METDEALLILNPCDYTVSDLEQDKQDIDEIIEEVEPSTKLIQKGRIGEAVSKDPEEQQAIEYGITRRLHLA